MPRISVASLLLFVVSATILFFGYHIYLASTVIQNQPHSQLHSQPHIEVQTYTNDFTSFTDPIEDVTPLEMEVMGSIVDPIVEPLLMPEVVGQSEEDLRETRQVQQTPPDAVYSDPKPVDQNEGDIHSESEFGDNLRHPEQTIEVAPPLGTLRMVQSGLGSEEPTPTFVGKHDPTVYSPEMAQNGGEFMSGIWAYDGDDGYGYSTI